MGVLRMLRSAIVLSLLVLASMISAAQPGAPERESFSAAPWEFIGPTNFQGRFLAVEVNPKNSNTIYAGTAGSGLWRSRTAGTGGDWQRIALGFPVASVSAIAIDSADTNTIYIGTGEAYRYQGAIGASIDRTTQGSYGYGILKTTNGGATWSQSLPWTPSQRRAVEVIRMNPYNRNTIFAGTSEGLYRSTDAGASWILALDVPLVQDIVVNYDDTTLVMATCGNLRSAGWGGYLSLDGGEGWFRLDNFPEFSGKARLEPFRADPNVMYVTVANDTGAAGGIWKTTDFGGSWDSVRRGRQYDGGWYGHFVAVNPTDQNSLVLGAVMSFFSSDGGATILESTGGGRHNHDYAHDPQNAYRLYVAADGGLFVTDDFGYGYTNISAGIVSAQFQNGFSNSSTDPNFALGQAVGSGGLVYTGSTAWSSSDGDEAGWTAISPANDSLLFRSMGYGFTIIRSQNRGASYINDLMGGGGGGGIFTFYPASWNTPVLASPSHPNIVYVGRDRIARSADTARSWLTVSGILDGNTAVSMAISATNPDTLYVGTAPNITTPHVFRTTNGGGAWQNVTGSLPVRPPLDLAVDPSNSTVVYAAFGDYGTGHLFKTTDAGGNWTDISAALPDEPLTAVIVDPLSSSMVYAGGAGGVYVSTDGGASWTSFIDALPEGFVVADLTISPANRKLRLATHGTGAFQHDLFSPVTATLQVELGSNWNLISLPLNAIDASPAAHFPSILPGTLFGYDGQYVGAAAFEPGKGYWAKFPAGSTSQQVSGPSLAWAEVSLKKGWNLVGSIDHEIAPLIGGIIASSWYEFTPTGYAVATALRPGRGYWLKASADGTITLGTP